MKEWKEYLFKVNGFEMTAVYNEDTIQKVFLPLLKQLQQLQKEKMTLIADLKKLEETGEMCIFCSHCCAGGKPVYQQSNDYLKYCTSCDETYSNFNWRGATDEKSASGLLEE